MICHLGILDGVFVHLIFLQGVPTSFEKEFSKKFIKITKDEKFVKVCFQSGKAVQISLQFDEIFDKQFQNFNFTNLRFSIKGFHIQNLLEHHVGELF